MIFREIKNISLNVPDNRQLLQKKKGQEKSKVKEKGEEADVND